MKKLDKKFIPKNMNLKKATICSILVISLLSSLMVSARLMNDQESKNLLASEQLSTLKVKSMAFHSTRDLIPADFTLEQEPALSNDATAITTLPENEPVAASTEEITAEPVSDSEGLAVEETQTTEVPAEEISAETAVSTAPQETATEAKTVYLTDSCNIRSLPSTDSEVLNTLTSGTALTVIATTDNGFYKLEDGSYVTSEYTTEQAPTEFTWKEQPATMTLYLTESCNHREQPTTNAASLGVISSGSAVNVVATTDQGFYKLDDNSYISVDYLTETAPVINPVKQSRTQTVVHDGTVQGILNAAPLNPRSTGFANVDAKIQEVFNQIGVNQMTDTYSKVKAVYDYLINTTEYGKNVYPSAGYGDITEGTPGYIAWNTMALLDRHIGPCNKYTSAFIAMVETIGLDAGYIDGMTSQAGGGMIGHVWAEVYIGGETYVFDPQVEDNMTSGGNIRYDRFCKTYAQLSGRYSNQNRLG